MITERGLQESSARLLPEGTVLVSSRAPIGYCALAANPIATNQGFKSLVLHEGFDPGFYYYVMTTKKDVMESVAGGSTFKEISGSVMKTLPVPVPPLAEQRAIAEVLSAFDDRIEWCRRISESVLGLADSLWEHSVSTSGAQIVLGDVVEFHNRRRVPLSAKERSEKPGPYPYYGATGVFDHIGQYIFDGQYVLVGEDGSVVKPDGTAVVQYVWGKFWVNNHAHVLTSPSLTPSELYLALRPTIVNGYVTGAAQPKLSMGRLKQVPVNLPSADSLEAARPAIAGLVDLIRSVMDEIEDVRMLRDALVPTLLAGELRIADPTALLAAG